jgi:hypothetical protein
MQVVSRYVCLSLNSIHGTLVSMFLHSGGPKTAKFMGVIFPLFLSRFSDSGRVKGVSSKMPCLLSKNHLCSGKK